MFTIRIATKINIFQLLDFSPQKFLEDYKYKE